MNSKRTDSAIIIVALLVLLLALGAFYGFDSFFGNRNRAVAEQNAIAEIIDVKGDYRMRFHDELHWQRARKGQKLVYDDAIFSGDKSEVDLKVMDSRLKLSEKTLIVLRKVQIFTYLKMDYGVLRGMIAKGDHFMLESNGERFELTGVDDANLVVDNRNGKLAVRVDSGNARVVHNGKVQNLSSRDMMVIGGNSDSLRFEAPVRGRMYTRQSEDSVQFRWVYNSGQVAPTSETFTLEAGADVSLSRLILKETVRGRQEFTAPRVQVPQDLYYRVKDSRGNFSEIHKLVLAQTAVPQLVLPTDRSVIPTAVGQTAPVDIEFAPLQPDARLVTQISRDPDFQQLVAERSGTSPQLSESLPAGLYFMRAKSVFGRVESDWSKSSTFIVQEALDPQRLAMARVPTKIVIPNREYPKSLYQAPRAQVQQFVKDLAPFPAFFADLMFKQQNLMVMRRAGKEQPRSITSPEFPTEWIRPGVVDLAYHFESEGVPATRSVLHRVLIRMEAPNRLRATDKGQMSWSPILFAEAYEVEVKDDQNRTQSLISPKPSARADVVGGRAYAYRVRALGADGQAISDWSRPDQFTTPVQAPPIRLAQRNEKPPQRERSPAQQMEDQAATSRSRIERQEHSLWQKVGYWIWAGTGINFVNVRQTIASTADVDYKNTDGPSGYLEAGYMSSKGAGVVASYKRTPGEVRVDNYPVNQRDFVWESYSAEGLLQLPWRTQVIGKPVNWGLRMGFQYHQFPFLFVGQNLALNQTSNNMLTGSFGFYSETEGRLKYYWTMRYQQPVRSSSEGGSSFDIKPNVAFDGSVGASYHFTSALKTGLFWYGQLHAYDFTYRSASETNSGQQSLFYSNMELRMGFDF